jgi:hypothetical protein
MILTQRVSKTGGENLLQSYVMLQELLHDTETSREVRFLFFAAVKLKRCGHMNYDAM